MVVPLAMGLSKRHKFSIMTVDSEKDEDETPPPFIEVQLGKEQIETYAFIDFGVDRNTISYELFQTLNNVNLIDIDDVFQAYTSHTTKAFGMCKLDLNVSKLICGDKFFVTQPEMQDELIILGQMWQRKYNYFFDWNCRLALYQSVDNCLWVPLQQAIQHQ